MSNGSFRPPNLEAGNLASTWGWDGISVPEPTVTLAGAILLFRSPPYDADLGGKDKLDLWTSKSPVHSQWANAHRLGISNRLEQAINRAELRPLVGVEPVTLLLAEVVLWAHCTRPTYELRNDYVHAPFRATFQLEISEDTWARLRFRCGGAVPWKATPADVRGPGQGTAAPPDFAGGPLSSLPRWPMDLAGKMHAEALRRESEDNASKPASREALLAWTEANVPSEVTAAKTKARAIWDLWPAPNVRRT